MGRKTYIADLAAVTAANIPNITSVVRGSEDGEIYLCFTPSAGIPIEMTLLALEVGGYPSENTWMITTESMDLPAGVNDVLQAIPESSTGMKTQDLITTISRKLAKHLATGSQNDPFDLDDESDVGMDSEPESEDEYPETDDDWDDHHNNGKGKVRTTLKLTSQQELKINRRIRSDLRAVKLAGFKVGVLSGMKSDAVSGIVSMSVKVDNLGLSEEAVQAWDLEPQQYIVLLAHYSNGYKEFDRICKEPAKSADVEFRLGVSNKYKPTLLEALAAFSQKPDDSQDVSAGTDPHVKTKEAGFFSLFISSSLNEFINRNLISLLKIRTNSGVGWLGAQAWFNDTQSRVAMTEDAIPPKYFDKDSDITENALPGLISKDHLTDDKVKEISFPLLAAQFALQYLVRCTEFCLVCHDKIEGSFEALKPYVCNKPLCLYQYMSLGFGPSVEHEILTQPYVVDLLVSFCYSSALNKSLREYPTGMSLSVPPVINSVTSQHGRVPSAKATCNDVTSEVYKTLPDITYDIHRKEIVFEENLLPCPVRNGEWVLICVPGRSVENYRVEDITFFPRVQLSSIFNPNDFVDPLPSPEALTPSTEPPIVSFVQAKIARYCENFDDMDDSAKAEMIVVLLETLPSIREMRNYLLQKTWCSEPSLRAWTERVSPAALGILRWIIASNRSCIVQVDNCPGQEILDATMTKIRLDQKISNIQDSWVQFRFAQGAPDKEQRFLNALKSQEHELNANHPTLFAWHGSPLQNWHSIIRNGLDFKQTLHGRAYGHGVYHAMEQSTSMGYAQHPSVNDNFKQSWLGSNLNISCAMSLNEIVNCPKRFTSSSPFLVVQHIDWIQCRYLLVQVQGGARPALYNSSLSTSTPNKGGEVIQDPRFTAKSTLNKVIGVPLCAVTTSRAFRADTDTNPATKANAKAFPNKRRKQSRTPEPFSLGAVTGVASDSDELEDIQFLLSDDEGALKGKGTDHLVILNNNVKHLTDFVAGSLDQSSLPMLDPPAYATSMATKSLQRNLREVLNTQNKTPLYELGWYIDPELISNVYQWIVELHSFDPDTPLARDMKKSNVTSVVLEIRFGKDYPHSPPFVRVIRPRFLPFMAGGGGHVTGGGAMCMELLTNSGWSAVSSIESVLLQVRMAMMNLEPKPARLERVGTTRPQRDYNVQEAIEAYRRACQTHGWQIPPDFGDFAYTAPAGSSSSQTPTPRTFA